MQIKMGLLIGLIALSAGASQAQVFSQDESRPYNPNADRYERVYDIRQISDAEIQATKLRIQAHALAREGRKTEACATIQEAVKYAREAAYKRFEMNAGRYSTSNAFSDKNVVALGKDEAVFCEVEG